MAALEGRRGRPYALRGGGGKRGQTKAVQQPVNFEAKKRGTVFRESDGS
jgi:hypothetical protein